MPVRFSDLDHRHMRRALALAHRGQGRVEPNPMVGCVLAKGPRVVGEGYHRAYGGPHAEVFALRRAARASRGATAYVTLEPCCHHGKTPPCTEALLQAGITRVVAAMLDPNEPVNGKGVRRLRRAGISVHVGLMAEEASTLNRPYLTLLGKRRPYVILKWAQSLDGKIATATGDSKWISGQRSRRTVHRLRARMDAILVGIGTVLCDDPMLTARDVPRRRIATRVILDTDLRIPEACRLAAGAEDAPVLVVTASRSRRAKQSKVARLRHRGISIESCPTRSGLLVPLAALRSLGRRGFTNVLVEGGGRVLSAFLDAGVVDEAYVFVAPKIIGGCGPTVSSFAAEATRIADATTAQRVAIHRSGPDVLYHLVFA